ncbi:MAG: xanthine dehydrogenase small subunit [Myxococcales bacterium]|nr:xanthine dehydrogenase small subunit [Myxococcales bacterium]
MRSDGQENASVVRLTINDEEVEVADVAPTTTLLEYLRLHRRLRGTKEGCAEGDCGACTVVVIDPDAPGGPRFRGVNSCLLLLPLLHGKRVYTVEALRGADGLHPVQESLASALGSQCGYCTPGIVMSMFEACYRRDLDAPWKLDDQMCGNLCRCTGYRPIRDAAQRIAGACPEDRFAAALARSGDARPGLAYRRGAQRFWIPRTFDECFALMAVHPDHRLVAGATDLGLDVTKGGARFPALISVMALPGLRAIERDEAGAWRIGATVRLADLEDATDHALPPLARMLRFFGARPIKNSATIGGNLCNASPIGDLAPALLALGATLVARSSAGERAIPIDEFFVGYRETALRPGELLVRVEIPALPQHVRASAYKVSKRREMDISAVAAAIYVDVQSGVVASARLAFGGMAATPARARKAEAALVGQPWSQASCEAAAAAVAGDFRPLDDHRGSAWFRRTVAANLLRGMYEDTLAEPAPRLPDRPTGTILRAEVLP